MPTKAEAKPKDNTKDKQILKLKAEVTRLKEQNGSLQTQIKDLQRTAKDAQSNKNAKVR